MTPLEKTYQLSEKFEVGTEIHAQPLSVINHGHSDTEVTQKLFDLVADTVIESEE